MSGGTWLSQNKPLPGLYINVKPSGNLLVSVGEKGTVAIAEPLSWGKTGVIQKVVPGEDLRPYIGYDITSPQAMFIREMTKGSDTTPPPNKILLYRPSGTGGIKAAATVGGVTITALYEGKRGNDVSMIISEDPDIEGSFDVATVVDGKIVDTQTVTEIKGLADNEWVTFKGEGDLVATVGTALEGGKDPTVSTGDYADFLTALEAYWTDTVIYSGTDEAVIQAFASFVERMSEKLGKKCQLVTTGGASCNSEWVISVCNGVTLEDGTVISPQQVVWWLGGAEAGAPYNKSLTYAQYPGAAEATPKLSEEQVIEATNRGEICFIDTFGQVKVCTDINTLTTYTTDAEKSLRKNRVMRVLSQICNDAYIQFSNNFIGKIDNNETGRNLYKGWFVGYLNEMQANNGIQNFTVDDVAVSPGTEVDAILVDVAIQPVDSIEKIYATITVRVNNEE